MTLERPIVKPTPSYIRRRIVRPNIHITSPFGWLNDPCGPGYDPSTKLYHLFYQCNPLGVDWGNMSWGHATSKDLVTWRYAPVHTALKPDKRYDREGVFTGCLGPFTHQNELSIFYTSISQLPFHWTNPAPRGSAGLALATSGDDGLTWAKSKSNPILKEEPEGVDATGFRDPYLADWPSLDRLRGKTSMYGLLSGGIQGKGPTSFIYAVNPLDIKEWEYLGPLVDMPLRWQPSQKWDSNYGVNWECVNFMTLQNGPVSREFLILGSEGDIERAHLQGNNLPPNTPPRSIRGQQWMAGDLVNVDDGFRLKWKYGGILDHGVYYAANSFADSASGRRIVYGWIPEEDCTPEHAHLKGWNGCQAFPRELYLQAIENVVGAISSHLDNITCVEQVQQQDGSTKIYTMGIRPLEEIRLIRDTALAKHAFPVVSLPSTNSSTSTLGSTTCATWNLTSVISINPQTCHKVGFYIRHAHDHSVRTTITFDVGNESLTVDRSRSAPLHPEFNTCDETGAFTLFRTGTRTDSQLEKLDLQIISDGDVLEVFANERFALATMVYSGDYEANGGITAWAEGAEEGCAVFEKVDIWDGLSGGGSCVVYEGDEEGDFDAVNGETKRIVSAL